ncbi:MAG TPA: dihydropteroate synthase [Fulvivirga sp.]|nr:dihydropteroate synthase [Fulvivirga sp.]
MPQNTFFSSKMSLNLRGNLVSLDSPLIMGILNITPDSFYSGSRMESKDVLLRQVEKMVEDGVDILDVGGYSTRPGASELSINEELERVIPALETIIKYFPETYISIDTFNSMVAKNAVGAGADIINDISGGNLDVDMFNTVTELNVPYILMHMKGTPKTMKNETEYDNLILEMIEYFQQKVNGLRNRGVKDIIIDPGFGFAKTIEQNYLLLKNLHSFNLLELPLLAGLSRKSMIYKKLGIGTEDALNGTTALNMIALLNGAKILRVHDVKEAVETVKLFNLTYPN